MFAGKFDSAVRRHDDDDPRVLGSVPGATFGVGVFHAQFWQWDFVSIQSLGALAYYLQTVCHRAESNRGRNHRNIVVSTDKWAIVDQWPRH